MSCEEPKVRSRARRVGVLVISCWPFSQERREWKCGEEDHRARRTSRGMRHFGGSDRPPPLSRLLCPDALRPGGVTYLVPHLCSSGAPLGWEWRMMTRGFRVCEEMARRAAVRCIYEDDAEAGTE